MKSKWDKAQAAEIESPWCAQWFDLPRLGVLCFPETHFLSPAKYFRHMTLEKACREIPGEKLLPTAGKSPQFCSQGHPGPSGTCWGLYCPTWVAKTCNWTSGFSCLPPQKSRETSAAAKPKRFIQVLQPGRMADFCLKGIPLPAWACDS